MKSPDYCSSDFGPRIDFRIPKGAGFARCIQVMGEPTVYRAITAITSKTPARFRLGAGEDLPDSWLVGIPEVLAAMGIPQYQPPPISQFYRANYVAVDEIELLNLDLSALNFLALPTRLQFKPPLVDDLTGSSFELVVRKDEDPDSAVLDTFAIANGRIAIDVDLQQILIQLTKAQIAALTWKTGWHVGNLVTVDGDALRVCAGQIQVV